MVVYGSILKLSKPIESHQHSPLTHDKTECFSKHVLDFDEQCREIWVMPESIEMLKVVADRAGVQLVERSAN